MVYALAQAASMTLHVSSLQRSPLLNDRAMAVPITISGPPLHRFPLLLPPLYLLILHRQPPYPADTSLTLTHTPTHNSFHTSSNHSTTTATSSSIPLTNHILALIPTQLSSHTQNGSPLPTPINITVPMLLPSVPLPTSFPPTNAFGQPVQRWYHCRKR
jgi:hypothetical protein